MLGSEAKKYSVRTTTISTEKPILRIAPPTPRIPPSRLLIFALLDTNRLTSVVITDATSNSSSMARKKSDSMKYETTVGKSWTNSVDCSMTTGTSADTKSVAISCSRMDATSKHKPRGVYNDLAYDTLGTRL